MYLYFLTTRLRKRIRAPWLQPVHRTCRSNRSVVTPSGTNYSDVRRFFRRENFYAAPGNMEVMREFAGSWDCDFHVVSVKRGIPNFRSYLYTILLACKAREREHLIFQSGIISSFLLTRQVSQRLIRELRCSLNLCVYTYVLRLVKCLILQITCSKIKKNRKKTSRRNVTRNHVASGRLLLS